MGYRHTLLFLLLLLLFTTFPRVHGFDDSNNGPLVPTINHTTNSTIVIIRTNNSTTPQTITITPLTTTNNTLTTVKTLTQNVTDPSYNQLEKQMETQLHNGDLGGAQKT